jgi:pectin methylesterase-like acyl-CoA thioesterase
MSVDISMAEAQPVADAMEEDFQVFTVAPAGESADFSTIQSAISAVMALEQGYCRMRISVRGGVYEEGQLDIPAGLQVVAADGCEPDSASPVIIAARADHPAISSRAKGALIRGIRIEHNGPFGSMACVVIEAGDIRMENCVVTGSVSIGVLVHGDSTPSLVGCEVLVCCGDGIKVSETGAPNILQCMIHDNDGFGIFCTGTSAGMLAPINTLLSGSPT